MQLGDVRRWSKSIGGFVWRKFGALQFFNTEDLLLYDAFNPCCISQEQQQEWRVSMRDDGESLDTILALLKQMEATLLGLKQLRGFVGVGVGQKMLEVLIEEAEAKMTEIKRRIIQ